MGKRKQFGRGITLLENVRLRHAVSPLTFEVPSKKEISNISQGDLVKLMFIEYDESGLNETCERMWVMVTERERGDSFRGILKNKPVLISNFELGDELRFHADNICDILREEDIERFVRERGKR